jgi:hypothetical protein
MRRFLVAYDYGMGAGWAFVVAASADEIRSMFPELTVFEQPPAWWGTRGFEAGVREYPLDRLASDWLGRLGPS